MPSPFHPLSDEELMIAYIDGKTAAFEMLYQRYETPLLRFIQRVLGSALNAQAEEVFQDVWMRIIAARQNYQPPEQSGACWKTWAFAIAHHAAIDRLRSQNKYVAIENDNDDYDPIEWIQTSLGLSHPSSEDGAYWNAAGSQLLQCIDKLPQAQRAAFLLHHEDDHSLEEMAQALAVSFETVKSRVRYAMQKLRKCMHNYLKEIKGNHE